MGFGVVMDCLDISVANFAEGCRRRDLELAVPAKEGTDLAHRLQFRHIGLQEDAASSYVERSRDWYKKGELKAMADLDIALTFDARCAEAYVLRGLVKPDRGDLIRRSAGRL
jgi:hypothetical protein